MNLNRVMNRNRIVPVLPLIFAALSSPAFAQFDDGDSVGEEQIKEKKELHDMKNELNDIKGTINSAVDQMQQLTKQASQQQDVKEFHLFARESEWETYSGSRVNCLTYNGKIPGPVFRITEGEMVKIVLHNQMKIATSLNFHGLIVPHSVGGIPRAGAGLVAPGQSFAFQFIPKQPGTFWYHPQLIHPTQKQLGLYGIIIVEPRMKTRPYDKDITLVLSEMRHDRHVDATPNASAKAVAWTQGPTPPQSAETIYLINGKAAPAIPAIELRKGDRVRLRIVNAGQEAVPLHLGGHKLEVVSMNGGDRLEPHVYRDTLTINPSDRVDIDFQADNPGVWSLASELAHQSTHKGKFPGGMACVVRYSELKVRGAAEQNEEN